MEIAPYSPTWTAMFEREASTLREALGAVAVRIDHNGSTAVPGLAAKPVIDIQVSVVSLQPMSSYAAALERVGYTHMLHPDDQFCPFFHKPAHWPHTHHVHVVEHGGAEERRTLAFRDYLRGHADARAEYERLKRALAMEYAGATAEEREAYASAKSAIIERVLAAAGHP